MRVAVPVITLCARELLRGFTFSKKYFLDAAKVSQRISKMMEIVKADVEKMTSSGSATCFDPTTYVLNAAGREYVGRSRRKGNNSMTWHLHLWEYGVVQKGFYRVLMRTRCGLMET